ncbi:hypothetical protein PSI23_19325 [Xenorhabdus sp. XENO-10]|uniref:Uncharacterized protein n=1 Tax=Xenorhabdus yunnanensis TaxID=3025878 RepID=A0ABT5LJT7_9GAMM|nr:hypothetical protein [Xenorhabdus yunnanensis]MDC9591379.1 hypothetical protein [Xenorhabdus yunnanensis]
MKNNNIYLLNKLSQKENKSLRNAYEREIKSLRDAYEKGNKSLRNAYEKKIKYLRDKQEKKIKSLNDEHCEEKIKSLNEACEREIQYLNDSYKKEVKSLNDAYEKEIQSKDKYNEWLSDLFRWNLSTVLTLNSIIILLYFVSIYSTNSNPIAMLCIYAFIYFSSIIFLSIVISSDKKFSFLLYLKAKIIYLFSYFHLSH